MKIQIRKSAFETNSSSVHTILINNRNGGKLEEYNKDIIINVPLYDDTCNAFITVEEKIELLFGILWNSARDSIQEKTHNYTGRIDIETIYSLVKVDDMFIKLEMSIKEYTKHNFIVNVSPNYYGHDINGYGDDEGIYLFEDLIRTDSLTDFIFNSKNMYCYQSN